MRESCTYGSVRGVRGNSHPYRDRFLLQCICLLLAHSVEPLRCEGSDAIGAKRTCRGRRERVDLTKMIHLGSGVCIAAVETMLIFVEGKERWWSTRRVAKCPASLLTDL